MKKIIALISVLALAGCASTPPQTLVKTETVVIVPDRTLFNCPNIRRFPKTETLTDVEVARLLVQLHKNNTDCQKNINAIYKYLEEAKKTAEASNTSDKK